MIYVLIKASFPVAVILDSKNYCTAVVSPVLNESSYCEADIKLAVCIPKHRKTTKSA